MSKLVKCYLEISMLSVFGGLKEKPLIRNLCNCLSATDHDKRAVAYSAMVSEIYLTGGSITDAVRRIVFEDENVYIKMRALGREIPSVISNAASRELDILSRVAGLTVDDFSLEFGGEDCFAYFPTFTSEPCDIAAEYEERIKNIKRHGYGIFSSYPMLRVDGKGEILPILSSDTVILDDFVGYERERTLVIENTREFLEGKPAANVLLFGDAGTGKSSTVKAVVNRFYSDGLRLIELRKDQLAFLPDIMGRIMDNPLKFIIFIDDLSFNKNDDSFSMLKAALEGSASSKAENALIYATSNRRHIVRETFDDREGGDVHRNDTMQEKLSLSERFGLSVWFGKPSKQLYLEIVHSLAARYGVVIDPTDLDIRAEEFALRRGNRSPRCAEQFIKSLL